MNNKHQIFIIKSCLNAAPLVFLIILCFFNLCTLQAAEVTVPTSHPSHTLGAISGGLGGTGLSSIDVGESYVLNPGTVAHLRDAVASFGTSSYKTSNKSLSDASTSGWHLSLNENGPESAIATSIFISKTRNTQKRPLIFTTSSNDAWLTLGNFVMPQMSAGINYHFHDTQTPLKTYQEHNFGIGFLWTPMDHMGVGMSFQNINNPPKDVPDIYTLGTTYGLGLLYIHKSFIRMRLDFTKKDHALSAYSYNETALGLETALSEWLYSRIGAARQVNELDEITQKYSFGLGFAGPRFGIHYSFQQYQLSQLGQEHNLDLVIPL